MKRNIVLVTVDSLRADHCGFMSGKYALTPTLDALSQKSVVYENAIASGPRTPSSMPVLFTGEYVQPQNKGVYRNWEEKRDRWRERRERIRRHLTRYRTLAERMHERGYTTAGVTANPWTSRDTAFDRGFDTFYAVGDDPEIRRNDLLATVTDRFSDHSADWLLRWPDFYPVVRRAKESLTDPYFLWVFLLDTHQPYFAPRDCRAENTALEMYYSNIRFNHDHSPFERLSPHHHERLKRAYRDACRSVDRFVRTLITDVRGDNPIIVVHADHGEAFFEHGSYGHRPQLYEENIHVPLLIHNSGHRGRIEELVSLRRLPRILSTLTESDGTFDPRSMTDAFVTSTTEEGERTAVRSNEWKYIRSSNAWEYVRDRGDKLYHLRNDPAENNDLVRRYPGIVRSLNAILERHERTQSERARIADVVESIPTRIEQESDMLQRSENQTRSDVGVE